MDEPKVIGIVKTWWPMVTVVLTVAGILSTSLIYYAKAETRALIQAELLSPMDGVKKQIIEQQDKLEDLEKQNSASQAKIDLMIQMMMKQNQVLDAQTKSIEALPEKVK
jgi:hypothetical protein